MSATGVKIDEFVRKVEEMRNVQNEYFKMRIGAIRGVSAQEERALLRRAMALELEVDKWILLYREEAQKLRAWELAHYDIDKAADLARNQDPTGAEQSSFV